MKYLLLLLLPLMFIFATLVILWDHLLEAFKSLPTVYSEILQGFEESWNENQRLS